MISIYLKTHNITGLKYLGKTKNDPFTYNGSGTYWLKHLKIHGIDITTKILFQSENIEEIKKEGIRLSKEFNIVENEEFANLMIEKGDGGSWKSFNKILKSNVNLRKEISNKISEGIKRAHKEGKYKNSPFSKGTKGFLGKTHSEITRQQMSKNNYNKFSDLEIRSRLEDYKNIERKRGYIATLARKWNVSSTQVKRFISKHF